MFEWFEPYIERYYAPHLTPREVSQLCKACSEPPTDFLNRIIKPHAYVADQHYYMSVDQHVHATGRPHYTAKELTNGGTDLDWTVQSYFTNTMRVAHPHEADFNSPSDRIVIAPYHVFTFEFDEGGIGFFQQQLSWFRCQKKPQDSPIGRFVADLRARYLDFTGLSVVYSGNKSFHYHCIFSTHVLASRCTPTSFRAGVKETWHRLQDEMMASPHLNIPATVQPDPQLSFPEWFRRIPNGIRVIQPKRKKPDWQHAFGVPLGEMVPQFVIWESLKERAPKGGANLVSIFDPASFTQTVVKKTYRKSSRPLDPKAFVEGAPDEMAYCVGKMHEIFHSYPAFSHFDNQSGLRAYFFNDPADKNPSSMMRYDHSRVMLQGNCIGIDPKTVPALPLPLEQQVERWCQEHRDLHNPQIGPAPYQRERTPLEQDFAERSRDKDEATRALSDILTDLLTDVDPQTETRDFLSAPEGISKSRAIIRSAGRAIKALNLAHKSPLIMFAFATYENASEKAAEFNQSWGKDAGARAIVLKSFTALYEEACAALQIRRITAEAAAQSGFKSHWSAIAAQQPAVIDYFREHYRVLRASLARPHRQPATPVIFTVHAVAQEWHKTTATRKMFAEAFWDSSLDEQTRHGRIRLQTAIGLLIHDEVGPNDLLLTARDEEAAWIDGLKANSPTAFAAGAGLSERWSAYDEFRTANPPKSPISFERACQLAEVNEWEHIVTTGYSGEYGAANTANRKTDIYADTAGGVWRVNRKTWCYTVAHKTLVLTTESVPTLLTRWLGGWNVIELDTPLIPKDVVHAFVDREVTAKNLPALVQKTQKEYRETHQRNLSAITNKCGHMVGTKTHHSAKGSNQYLGAAVLQTMILMPAEQYEFFEMLNALTGRDDMVRTHHFDEFNQSAGRNLGFRKRDGADHLLLISARLFECLDGEARYTARYVMQQVTTARQARAAKSIVTASVAYDAGKEHRKQQMAALRAAIRGQQGPSNDWRNAA